MEKVEITPTAEWIQSNFDNTLKLVKSSGLSKVEDLLQFFGERYMICPASSKKEHGCCFPGGLAYHNLHVLKWFNKFSSLHSEEVSKATMIKLSVLHDIGRLGSKQNDYYVRSGSNYYDEKGVYYHYVDLNPYQKLSDRAIFLAHEFNIPLTEEEYLSILLSDSYDKEHDSYRYKEPKLALLLQNSVNWARSLEKDFIVHWPE